MNVRPFVVAGVMLVVLGVAALAVPSFMCFTRDRVADAGFFTDISRPHTVVFNPIVGGLALAAGVALVVVGLGAKPA